MTLLQLFSRCLEVPYLQAVESANYYTERIGGILYIYLQSSDGGEDWKNNLDFPARPYKRMGKTVWYAHRGFVRVWRAIEPPRRAADRRSFATEHRHGRIFARRRICQ